MANLVERILSSLVVRVSPARTAETVSEAIRSEARSLRTTGIDALHLTGRLGRDLVLPVEPLLADNNDQRRHIAMPINVLDPRNARQGVARRSDRWDI